jgi:hypothetical protein
MINYNDLSSWDKFLMFTEQHYNFCKLCLMALAILLYLGIKVIDFSIMQSIDDDFKRLYDQRQAEARPPKW